MSIKYANGLSISILKSHICPIKKRAFVKQKPAFLWGNAISPLLSPFEKFLG